MQHAIADYLIQLESGEEGIGVKDNFRDAQLFQVETMQSQEMNEDMEDNLITKMTIVLTTWLPPQEL